jgi:DnaJ like chaperone protein
LKKTSGKIQMSDILNKLMEKATNPVGGCVTVILCWLMIADGKISEEEDYLLQQIAHSINLGDEISNILSIVNSNVEELYLVCAYLKDNLNDEGKIRLLELCISMIVSDNYVAVGEMYIIRFIADLFGFTAENLEKIYREQTGHSSPNVGDPSSIEWWQSKEKSKEKNKEDKGKYYKPRNRSSIEQTQWAYQVLDLEKNASNEQIKSAYRNLSKLHHPDKFINLGPEAVAAANIIFQRINEAYEILSNR